MLLVGCLLLGGGGGSCLNGGWRFGGGGGGVGGWGFWSRRGLGWIRGVMDLLDGWDGIFGVWECSWGVYGSYLYRDIDIALHKCLCFYVVVRYKILCLAVMFDCVLNSVESRLVAEKKEIIWNMSWGEVSLWRWECIHGVILELSNHHHVNQLHLGHAHLNDAPPPHFYQTNTSLESYRTLFLPDRLI